VEAVVVGGLAFGERDRIVRLLTPDHGRVSVIARGAASSKRRFAGALDLGARIAVELRGRGQLRTLQEVTVLSAPRAARSDLLRIALLAYGCEIAASLAPEGQEAPRLYGVTIAWLSLLDATPGPGQASRHALEGKVLTFAGLLPTLQFCARCGEPLVDPAVFDPASGGGQHQRCGGGRQVACEALLRLEALRRTPLRDTPGQTTGSPAWLLGDFLRYQLGQSPNSRALVEEVEGVDQ